MKRFVAGIGTNGYMAARVSKGRFTEFIYDILKAHASWLTGIEVGNRPFQDVWRVQ